MIHFEGVHKWFKKLHVLNDINLHIKQNETVVICGPSGSGKSTLIKPKRLSRSMKGSLTVDGFDMTDRNRLMPCAPRSGFVFSIQSVSALPR
jgi:polar amino acid transport system ATP-binding protein